MKKEMRVFINEKKEEAWLLYYLGEYELTLSRNNNFVKTYDDLELALYNIRQRGYKKEIKQSESSYEGIREI